MSFALCRSTIRKAKKALVEIIKLATFNPMQFNNLTSKEAISHHLSLVNQIDDNTIVFSSLIAVLRDSREVTGRNLETGEKIISPVNGRLDSWLGALGYLTVLDQIGKCYRPKSKSRISKGNSIIKALSYFTLLSNKEINAIYALRCAFSHDYSLFNIGPKGENDSLTQHFTVTGLGYNTLICLPTQQWNGKHEDKSFENRTVINLIKLGDLIEAIYSALVEFFNANGLIIELKGGHTELKDRYLMYAYKINGG